MVCQVCGPLPCGHLCRVVPLLRGETSKAHVTRRRPPRCFSREMETGVTGTPAHRCHRCRQWPFHDCPKAAQPTWASRGSRVAERPASSRAHGRPKHTVLQLDCGRAEPLGPKPGWVSRAGKACAQGHRGARLRLRLEAAGARDPRGPVKAVRRSAEDSETQQCVLEQSLQDPRSLCPSEPGDQETDARLGSPPGRQSQAAGLCSQVDSTFQALPAPQPPGAPEARSS